MKNPNIKKVWDKVLHRCYWDHFYRFEEEWDHEKGYYHIYINKEEVERCPLNASEEEVRDRFHELLEEHGIEWTSDEDMYVRKELN